MCHIASLTPNETVCRKDDKCLYIKNVESSCLLVPRSKGSGITLFVETSNAEPHVDVYIICTKHQLQQLILAHIA